MRTFKFKPLRSNIIFSIDTDARTMQELRTEILKNSELVAKFDVRHNSNLSEISLIDRHTKTSYHLDDAILPPGDALFFVSLTKSDGGGYVPGMGERWEEFSYNQLRELCALLNEKYDGDFDIISRDKEQLLDDLAYYYDTTGQDILYKEEAARHEMGKSSLQAIQEELILCAEVITSIANNLPEDLDEYVDGVTVAQLTSESKKIYQWLKDRNLIRD